MSKLTDTNSRNSKRNPAVSSQIEEMANKFQNFNEQNVINKKKEVKIKKEDENANQIPIKSIPSNNIKRKTKKPSMSEIKKLVRYDEDGKIVLKPKNRNLAQKTINTYVDLLAPLTTIARNSGVTMFAEALIDVYEKKGIISKENAIELRKYYGL